MERSELLARLGFVPPEACRVRVIIDTDAKTKAMMTLPSCTICSLRNLMCVVSVPPISRSKPPKGVCRPTAWNAVIRRYAAC